MVLVESVCLSYQCQAPPLVQIVAIGLKLELMFNCVDEYIDLQRNLDLSLILSKVADVADL